MAHNGQNDLLNAAKNAVENSEHNPIQLNNDICVQDMVVVESDNNAPEVVSSLRMCDVVRPNQLAVPLPYGYILESNAIHEQPNNRTADVGEDSEDFEIADMTDEDKLEYSNEKGTNQVLWS